MSSLGEQYREQQEAGEEAQRRKAQISKNVLIGAAAVLGVIVLAFVVIQLLPASGQERYDSDLTAIQNAMLVFKSGLHPEAPMASPSLEGGRRTADGAAGRYPTFARLHVGTDFALEEAVVGSGEITTLGVAQSNPTGSLEQSGTPLWEDVDGDGKRIPANDKLFYLKASPEPSVDHWNTTTVMFQDTAYVVDSREWFVDIGHLVTKGYLKALPGSASADNVEGGTGSYIWYVDESGSLKSLLYSAPTIDSGGFQDVYP